MSAFRYDGDEELYLAVIDGVEFSCEEESASEEEARRLAQCYHENLPKILDFLFSELEEVYGKLDREKLPDVLGRPRIDLDTFQVLYLDHSLDGEHIISFEFGDGFESMENLSIDG